MDIDYLLIILPSIIFLGVFGLILIIWHGHFRSKKEKIHLNAEDAVTESPSKAELSTSRLEPTLTKSNLKEEITNSTNSTTQHDIDNYIILQLMAPQQRPYRGYELIQTLTSAGFHYGKMNIFHFYADSLSKKELLFSLASAIEPGTFDLDNTGEIVCPGLCLFMSIHKVKSALTAFDLMWETAQILAQDLGGILCDRQLQPIDDLTCYHSQLHAYA
ncbi:cell division protein ZipA C-terminal FtsZ-binding domain-containing protein [Rickettsiella endosymbiont of Miltochrista miniata]|uniref:cell division protein ZipA C-terminal FtsZ-binding domain-containing protein n=1 Tax=Rickettsiella endosymbiont of Miltochrista miniata TaxID=3066239 RepID=UPI00313C75FD